MKLSKAFKAPQPWRQLKNLYFENYSLELPVAIFFESPDSKVIFLKSFKTYVLPSPPRNHISLLSSSQLTAIRKHDSLSLPKPDRWHAIFKS